MKRTIAALVYSSILGMVSCNGNDKIQDTETEVYQSIEQRIALYQHKAKDKREAKKKEDLEKVSFIKLAHNLTLFLNDYLSLESSFLQLDSVASKYIVEYLIENEISSAETNRILSAITEKEKIILNKYKPLAAKFEECKGYANIYQIEIDGISRITYGDLRKAKECYNTLLQDTKVLLGEEIELVGMIQYAIKKFALSEKAIPLISGLSMIIDTRQKMLGRVQEFSDSLGNNYSSLGILY
ncbi:hypothetical protein J4434_01240 [Candidatus Woesearchaeota archaeon]|nr:hypothetical protein [Candidatus Woesearchaeota archaeon]